MGVQEKQMGQQVIFKDVLAEKISRTDQSNESSDFSGTINIGRRKNTCYGKTEMQEEIISKEMDKTE